MRIFRLILFLLLGFAPPALAAEDQPLTVFAAASLNDALRELAGLWQRQGHAPVRLNFAASSLLARQIAAGAPADIFASADEAWMDALARQNLIVPESRRDVLFNRLVLIVPAATPVHVTIARGFDLAALLGPGGRLAVGDPAHVPAGIYAKQALMRLGVWSSVADRLAPAADVRAALLLVARGEAPAGIVYETDARASREVAVAGTFPEWSHDRITYPFAIVRGHDGAEARAWMRFLVGKDARAVFARYGFATE
ncbi:MAG: molybdate ABC transporter substrate-binding protein [Acidobacteriia bacterium]|nr:molybdate ABC transporter substrate-binding protein [Methyloceanibacter sp.]MCL6491230.1 molybdate ABC transporter substrate-binding protein [Terriglobia bacterium]